MFGKRRAIAHVTQESSSYPRLLLHFQFVFSHVNQVGGFSVHCADMSCNRHKKLWTFDSRILRMYCTEYVFWIVGHATPKGPLTTAAVILTMEFVNGASGRQRTLWSSTEPLGRLAEDVARCWDGSLEQVHHTTRTRTQTHTHTHTTRARDTCTHTHTHTHMHTCTHTHSTAICSCACMCVRSLYTGLFSSLRCCGSRRALERRT